MAAKRFMRMTFSPAMTSAAAAQPQQGPIANLLRKSVSSRIPMVKQWQRYNTLSSQRENNSDSHPEERRIFAARLEGWPLARLCLSPSFETALRASSG
jgi:hypothetical protein